MAVLAECGRGNEALRYLEEMKVGKGGNAPGLIIGWSPMRGVSFCAAGVGVGVGEGEGGWD